MLSASALPSFTSYADGSGAGQGLVLPAALSWSARSGVARAPEMMRETEDGFRIAEADLKLRGEGEVLGTRQSGLAAFRLARIEGDGDLLETARDDARLIVERDPKLESPRGQALRVPSLSVRARSGDPPDRRWLNGFVQKRVAPFRKSTGAGKLVKFARD